MTSHFSILLELLDTIQFFKSSLKFLMTLLILGSIFIRKYLFQDNFSK